MTTIDEANKEAQQKLEEWNEFIEKSLDGPGYIDPLERLMKLLAWQQAENRAGALRRQVSSDGKSLS